MTTSLSALPSSLANLLTNYASSGPQADGTTAATPQAAPTPAGGALGTDPAYTLKLGAQGSSTALLGYSRLATLGSQFESAISPLESSAGSSGQGSGSVAVNVQQLAQPQTLISGTFGDNDQVSLGTGTLTIATGPIASDGSFTAQGAGTAIPIKTGTLDDIVTSINAANAGVTASVVQQGGGYALQLTGSKSGTDQAFSVQGLSELAFDPATPNTSMLSETQTAQNAVYTVNGNTTEFGSNSNVPVSFGVTANFTATGALTVATPPQVGSIQSLVNAFNTVQQSIATMAGTNGQLANDVNLAAGMFKNLGDAATGTVDTGGKFTALSQVGVSVQTDGTLSIDQTTLAAAVSSDPTDLQSLISGVSTAMDKAMAPYLGSTGSITSQFKLLSAEMMQGDSLLNVLNSSGTASTGGTSSSQGNLLDALNGGNSTASTGTGTSSSLGSLLDSLNGGNSTSSTGTASSPSSLLDVLNGSNSTSASGTQKDLLDYLNADSSASSTAFTPAT